MIFVDIDPLLQLNLAADLFERTASAALAWQSGFEADLTLVLSGDARIRELNREFLGRDTPTDVLSFPGGETDPETGRLYLGDVVISVPRAATQAESRSHALEAELQLLVVHGVLHLLGYDHDRVEDKARMWAAQAEVLESLGLSASIVHE